uniref:Uncharacterized protein n=1 Tax=Phlebotomus papatasi TaxID=29031 RepID=A0A1B0D8M8_PHLPP
MPKLRCAVTDCRSFLHKTGQKVSFHRFPAGDEKRALWIKNLRISHPVTKDDVVCSAHFNPDDIVRKYVRSSWQTHRKPDAVPMGLLESSMEEVVEMEEDENTPQCSIPSTEKVMDTCYLDESPTKISDETNPLANYFKMPPEIFANESLGYEMQPTREDEEDEMEISAGKMFFGDHHKRTHHSRSSFRSHMHGGKNCIEAEHVIRQVSYF